jgi:hypothetical protein
MRVRGWVLSVAGLFWLLSATQAQDGVTKVKGKIMIGDHRTKMEVGKIYEVRVEGEGFRPVVQIRPGRGIVGVRTEADGDTFSGYFMPMESREHRILITPETYDLGDGPFTFNLTIRPIILSEKPALQEKTKLTADDPIYKEGGRKDCYFKGYPFKMKAKQAYVIEMISTSNLDMEPNLFLEAPDGNIVADNDAGIGKTARIVYVPRRDGEYRIIASTYARAVGDFTLTVRTQHPPKE